MKHIKKICIINKKVQMFDLNKPILKVSQVAKEIGISADRLRTYDEENLSFLFVGKIMYVYIVIMILNG